MINAAETRQELEKVSSLVLAARRLLASGALVDLSAIQDRVGAVCDAVQGMPREDGQGLLDELLALIRRLDMLGADLKEQLDQMSARLDGDN